MIELWKMTPYLSAVDSMTQPLNEIVKSLYAKVVHLYTASHTIDENLNIALWNAYPFFQCCVMLCKVRRFLTALHKHVQSDTYPGNMLANPWC